MPAVFSPAVVFLIFEVSLRQAGWLFATLGGEVAVVVGVQLEELGVHFLHGTIEGDLVAAGSHFYLPGWGGYWKLLEGTASGSSGYLRKGTL